MGRPPGVKNKPKIEGEGQPIPKKNTVRMSDAQQERLEEESDMLFIPPELVPEGMRYNWKTLSVFGQQQSRRFGRFQATGWEPVPASRHPGLFTPMGYDGFIEYDGLVLMEKPEELCLRSEARDFMKARDQVQTKEQQLRGGDIRGVSLDAQHKTAVRSNKINKSYERFEVPD